MKNASWFLFVSLFLVFAENASAITAGPGSSLRIRSSEPAAQVTLAFADPLFVDWQKDNFRLRPGSPAFKLGFEPIPFDKIGIRPV